MSSSQMSLRACIHMQPKNHIWPSWEHWQKTLTDVIQLSHSAKCFYFYFLGEEKESKLTEDLLLPHSLTFVKSATNSVGNALRKKCIKVCCKKMTTLLFKDSIFWSRMALENIHQIMWMCLTYIFARSWWAGISSWKINCFLFKIQAEKCRKRGWAMRC